MSRLPAAPSGRSTANKPAAPATSASFLLLSIDVLAQAMPTKDCPKLFGRLLAKFSKDRHTASSTPPAAQCTEVQSSQQGDVEHRPDASSIVATESCTPPFPSPADAQAARPSVDAGTAVRHQPAAASRALPPPPPVELPPKPTATESTEQQTPIISISERLWNAAYDSLTTDHRDLVRLYVETLERSLGDETPEHCTTDLSARLGNPTNRQKHMRELVEKGQEKISRASRITTGVGEVADFILKAKKMVDLVLQSVPQAAPAALPWAGVCLGLQILRNPAQATKSNLAGIAHVISRMDWYCALTEHLLKKNNIAAGNDFQAVLRQLEERIIKLYKALLLYQMRSLGNIHQTLQDFISLQKDVRKDDMEAACRRDLRVVDPQHDMERIERGKDELLDDAYQWILRTPEYIGFTNWDDSESNYPPRRLLWVKGHAGTGKTMLMIGLIRQLSDQPVILAPALSFFFCQGTDAALNNATAVLRSLIWLLLLQQPYLISHLLQKYKESGADLFRDKNAFYALSEAFRNMLRDPQLTPVYLAVDALDECAQGQPGRSDLIRLISTSLTLSRKVKWLLSSRPEVDLLTELSDLDTNSPDASKTLIELDPQRLADPVNAYIDHKFTILRRRKGYNDSVLAEVSREVRQRAENTFLWVALAFRVLETIHGGYAVKRITEMPPGLSELYNHMMNRIEAGQIIEPQDCKTVLVVTSLAFRPLSIPELSVLSDLPLDVAETAIEMCGSFLTIAKGIVNLIHQSAKDYLEKNYESRLQPAGPAQGHAEIGRRSIDAMSSILRPNLYNLDLGFKPENMAPPDPDPLAPVRYSCVFWAEHLCSLDDDNSIRPGEPMDVGKVFGFLKEYFLRWLEIITEFKLSAH
ncbi:uncharacterized protein B0T15DRAFT_502258 [Chaetomium strumarium]|uniref:NACHT domain-containing protein n=1 Tax=Chaetomium strumarium TaxID=1170767 RepID=A0AAJ0GSF4_9PEZI|nr:hypothetical protein B0T15DRAFT_502258 [Chaetomium strumarium]